MKKTVPWPKVEREFAAVKCSEPANYSRDLQNVCGIICTNECLHRHIHTQHTQNLCCLRYLTHNVAMGV